MIKIEIDRKRPGHYGTIKAEGTLGEILAELSTAIGGIYHQMRNCDPGAAEAFRQALVASVNDADSPVWRRPKAVGFGFYVPTQPGGAADD